jgi:hypothetical protein
MIESLQVNRNEINLITVQRLEGKEKLIQNLQSHISRLQRQLKYEVIEKSITRFKYTLYSKICNFKIKHEWTLLGMLGKYQNRQKEPK